MEDFCNSFDSILREVSPDELKRLSARPLDLRTVNASRKSSRGRGGDHHCCHFSVDLVTAVGWLDVLDVSVRSESSDQEAGGGVVATLCLASTGFLPLVVPGACLGNILCCWVPFLSVEQTQRLDFFSRKMGAKHSIESEIKLCSY